MPYQLQLLMVLVLLIHQPVVAQSTQEQHYESADAGGDVKHDSQPELDVKQVEDLILAHTNEFRVEEKRERLKKNSKLAKAARSFANDLAETDKLSHTADGNEPWDRTAKAGYEHAIILENIAYEYRSSGFTAKELAKKLVEDWEDSPEHRKNLVDPDVYEMGIGIARSSTTGRYYAVQVFGRPKSATITFKISNQIDVPITYSIDGESYSAEPRYTITYERSRPSLLRFSWPDDSSVTPDAKKEFRPENGSTYKIRTTDDGMISVDRR